MCRKVGYGDEVDALDMLNYPSCSTPYGKVNGWFVQQGDLLAWVASLVATPSTQ